jgi:hypothetical protein
MKSDSANPNAGQVEAIFNAALAFPGAERVAYLSGVCGTDAKLRERVEALLRAHEQAGGFLPEQVATSASPALFPVPPSGGPDAARAEAGTTSPPAVALAAPVSEQPGTLIGRYKILEKIGEGGFGVVYVAEQREAVKRRVALKIIKLGMDTRQVVARFEAERQALALMDHPNIAKVLDAGATDTGRPFFVMELVKGIPITHYCNQEKLGTRGAAGSIRQGLPRHPACAPEGDHPPGHQADQHPGDAARRGAGVQGD